MNAPSLVDALGVLLQRTYDIPPERPGRVSRFVVGDEGHRRLVERARVVERIDRRRARARLLLRRRATGWSATLYLPNDLVARLEECDPRRALDAGNIDDFLALVEEVDHLVTFADRACHGDAEVSLLELEWHAAVSKALVATHFVARLAGRTRLGEAERAFVDYHVFHKTSYPRDELGERYREAERLAFRFVSDLRERQPTERVRRLRRFHRASHHEKLRRYAS